MPNTTAIPFLFVTYHKTKHSKTMSNPLEPARRTHLRKAIKHLKRAAKHLDEAQDREQFFPVELEDASREVTSASDKAIRVLKEGTSATEHEIA